MTTFTRIATLARRHHRLITGAQLAALEYSPEAVRHLVRTERLWRVHRGVYALEGPLTPRGWTLAAVLRCGPRCVASHLTAAAVLGLRETWPGRPHVTVARRSGATGPPSIAVHRSETLTRVDVDIVDAIPVTARLRTAVDCAPLLDAKNLKALLRRMEHDAVDLRELDRPGIPRNLRSVLHQYVTGSGLAANDLEASFYEICAHAGLPLPATQGAFPQRRRVDFVWHDLRLIAETDGRRTHDTFIAFTDDRVRDRAHTLAGYATVRFTWAEVELDAAMVARELVAGHARRRLDLRLDG